MPSVSNRGCRKATTERGSTGVGSVWRKLIIQRNNHCYDLLAALRLERSFKIEMQKNPQKTQQLREDLMHINLGEIGQ